MKNRSVEFLLASIVLSSSGGCTAILDLPEPVDSFRWCLDAEPAAGRSSSNLAIDDIQTAAGNWLRGCKCYCPKDNAIMVDGEAGLLAAGSADEAFYLGQVQTLRLEAEVACTQRVLDMQVENATVYTFDDPMTVSCADAVADEAPYFSSGCVLDDDICPGGGGADGGGRPGTSGAQTETGTTGTDASTDGADTTGADDGTSGGAGGAGVYGLESWSDVISCPSADECEVAAWFVDELLEDLSVLEHDAILIRPGTESSLGHQGFRFESLGPESLPAALGFAVGDVLWAVDGILLTDFAAVGRAFEQLDQAPSLTARVDRDGQEHRRTVRIVTMVGS